MKIFVAHSSGFDFTTKLYGPLRSSALNTAHEIHLPQEGKVEEITRDIIAAADVLLVEVSMPSLGAGIEMGWADAFDIPIIALYEKGTAVSFSIDNVITDRIEYKDEADMIKQIEEALSTLASV